TQKPQIIIAKFGGTSVADFDAMNNSAAIIASNPNVKIVVLSASASVTNLLIELVNKTQQARLALLAQIRAIQYAIVAQLPHPQIITAQIDQLLEKIHQLSEPTNQLINKALLDELVAYGE